MKNFTKIILSLFLCFSISGTVLANEKNSEDNSFWKKLDDFLADDDEKDNKKSSQEVEYIKPKKSLNSNMFELLDLIQAAIPNTKIEKVSPDKAPPFFKIDIIPPIQIEGYGISEEYIDRYSVALSYHGKHIDISTAAVAFLSSHLGGKNKGDQYMNIISDLQKQTVKKIKTTKNNEIITVRKYDGRQFSFKFFKDLGIGILSITQIK